MVNGKQHIIRLHVYVPEVSISAVNKFNLVKYRFYLLFKNTVLEFQRTMFLRILEA